MDVQTAASGFAVGCPSVRYSSQIFSADSSKTMKNKNGGASEIITYNGISKIPFYLQVSSISQIRFQATHIVNFTIWLDILAILAAKGLVPGCIYEMRTPCEFQFDVKLAFHEVFTRYITSHPGNGDFGSESE